jgi:hypothetical protein
MELRYLDTFLGESKKRQKSPDLNEIKYLSGAFFGYHNRGDPWKEERYSGD